MNEESLFVAALEKSTPAERLAFLDEACRGDDALRQRVEQLLAADEHSRGILEGGAHGDFLPAIDLGAPLHDVTRIAEGPGDWIGPYKLKEQIGEGGFGLVFVAEQQQPMRRKVALKIIKPGMDTREVIARFEAERQALALMDHPHIAKILDGGTTSGLQIADCKLQIEGKGRPSANLKSAICNCRAALTSSWNWSVAFP